MQSLKLKTKPILSSLPAKQQKQFNKHKLIAKQGHINPEVKLLKINSNKNEKKNLKQKNTKTLFDPEVQRAFKVHSRNRINLTQCCKLHEKTGCSQLQTLWSKINKKEIDFSTFQDIYLQINSKDNIQMNSQLFQMLSQNKETIDLETLSKMVESSNWRGQTSNILSVFGNEAKISFQQFNKTMNLYSTIN